MRQLAGVLPVAACCEMRAVRCVQEVRALMKLAEQARKLFCSFTAARRRPEYVPEDSNTRLAKVLLCCCGLTASVEA
jgi:hypothetical protein